MIRKFPIIVILFFLMGSFSLFSETIRMRSGETLEGKVLRETDKVVTIQIQHGVVEVMKNDLLEDLNKPPANEKTKGSNGQKILKNLEMLKEYFTPLIKDYGWAVILAGGVIFVVVVLKVRSFFLLLIITGGIVWGLWSRGGLDSSMPLKDYAHLIHYKTHSLSEVVNRENPHLQISSLGVYETRMFRKSFESILSVIMQYKKQLTRVNPPGAFKEIHHKYLELMEDYIEIGNQLSLAVGKGYAGVETLKILLPKIQELSNRETTLVNDYNQLLMRHGFVLAMSCNCQFHRGG